MIGAIAGVGSTYRSPYLYHVNQRARQLVEAANAASPRKTQETAHASAVVRTRGARPDVPVQPVDAVKPVGDGAFNKDALLHFMASDPVEAAVRSRIQYLGNGGPSREAQGLTNVREDERTFAPAGLTREDENRFTLPSAEKAEENRPTLPGEKPEEDRFMLPGMKREEEARVILPGAKAEEEEDPFILPGAKREEEIPGLPGTEKAAEQLPGVKDDRKAVDGEDEEKGVPVTETESAQEVAEDAECETCKRRKYQDGSDDPGVSFKTPTNVDPKMAQSAVRGHENEHVVREQAKARQEDRKVLSQSVTYHTAICPECGKVYVSGGTTRTVTIDKPKRFEPQSEPNETGRLPFYTEA